MNFDFSHPAPKIPTLAEAQSLIDALWSYCAEAEVCAKKQSLQILDLKEKLNTNSSNSSKAPSSDLFQKKPRKKKYHGAGKNRRLKQGGQPGHPGKGRKLLPPEAVDAQVVCLPEAVCECGGCVQAHPEKVKRHQQYELPEIKPIVTEYQQIYGTCTSCGMHHCGSLPKGVAPTLLAPRATTSVSILSGDYRLSKRSVQRLFDDFFNLPISLGTISNTEHTVSGALKSPVEAAQVYVREHTEVVHADETSHKQQGTKQWMWLATTLLVAVFIIRGSRSMKAAQELLGEGFAGILVTDRYASYHWIKTTGRQFCWAHLKRDMQKISERSGQAGQIGDEILAYIRRMFRLWHRLKDHEINRKTFQAAMIPIRSNIECLLIGGSHCGHSKTEHTCQRILKQKQALWTFVDIEGVEPTNNLAEQLIRFYVLWRKSSFGTQSDRGNRFVERMMTTTATCKLQGRNRYDYITAAVSAHLKGESAPSLLPDEQKFETDDLAA